MHKTFTAASIAGAAFINGVAASQLPGSDEPGEGFKKISIKVNGTPTDLFVVYDRTAVDEPSKT